jgi:hypothetical protein
MKSSLLKAYYANIAAAQDAYCDIYLAVYLQSEKLY